MRRTTTMAILAASCAAMAIAPSLAVAKQLQYEGPINITREPSNHTRPDGTETFAPTSTPLIQLKIAFVGKTPVRVGVEAFGLWGPCSGFGFAGGSSIQGATAYGKIKRGTFSLPLGSDSGYFDLKGSTVTGRFTRGRATGTVRRVAVIPPGLSPDQIAWGTCDSGVVSWTAPRVSLLTPGHDVG
jgi:hypothetical protein